MRFTGNKASARIWRETKSEARDPAVIGGWREPRFRTISRVLEEFDREFPEGAADPEDDARLRHQRMLLEKVENSLNEDGLEGMARVYQLLELGLSWPEIGTELGQSADAIESRFYQFRKNTA